MLRNLRIWTQCPEIRTQISTYWLLFTAQVLTLVILSPLILLVILFAWLGDALSWLAEKMHWPYETVIDFLEAKRADTVRHASSILSVEEISKRLKDEQKS